MEIAINENYGTLGNLFMLENERDKSYIYDILKYSQEISDILKGENHNSFVNNRIKRLVIERLIQIILFFMQLSR